MINDNDVINLQKYKLIKDWIAKWVINQKIYYKISIKTKQNQQKRWQQRRQKSLNSYWHLEKML